MRKGCPALQANRLGAFWTTKIGSKKVVVFKSDSHMSQDTKKVPKAGETLPNYDLWKQIIDEVQPKLVITTGTAGGIGPKCEVGDVVVSPIVRFDCQKWLKSTPFHDASYTDDAPKTKYFSKAKTLFKTNASQLPTDNTRTPKIIQSKSLPAAVLTTDFFGFDTSDNRYGLKGLGSVSEMGDAILEAWSSARWGQRRRDGLRYGTFRTRRSRRLARLKQQAQLAAQIYKGFGRWSSICSAIVCWAARCR